MAIPLLGAIPGLLGAVPGLLGSAGGALAGAGGGALGMLGKVGGMLGGPLSSMMGPLSQGLSGALGGLSGKLGMSKEREEKLKYTPEQQSQVSASQSLIPFYLQMISGQMPDFLKRYLAQTQGQLAQQQRGGISEYLRNIGRMGMDFGPQQAAQLGNIYQGMTPALTQALTQARMGMTEGAVKGLQQWSMIPPTKVGQPPKQPSYGQMAGAGATQGIADKLGALKIPGKNGGSTGVQAQSPYKTPTTAESQQWIQNQMKGLSPGQFGISRLPY